MSDLRDSGSLEQDADCILLLYSESYYRPDDPAARPEMELIIEKQRQGRRGVTCYFAFDKDRATFTELAGAGPDACPIHAPRDAQQVRDARQVRRSPESAPGRAVLGKVLGQE
jgi:hypothetical protein